MNRSWMDSTRRTVEDPEQEEDDQGTDHGWTAHALKHGEVQADRRDRTGLNKTDCGSYENMECKGKHT